jgi:ribosome-binding protein aMBF1 (putative translation factor)
MIQNQRQYRITREEAAKMEAALRAYDRGEVPKNPDVQPAMRQLCRDAIASLLQEMRDDIAEYEAIRKRKRRFVVHSLEELAPALLKARIASGLSTRELARRVQISERQLRRYEASDFRSAPVWRLLDIADELGIKFQGAVSLK